MNINYQFADIFGSVYRNGNVKFLPNGDSIISPVGNKLKLFQLKENVSSTLNMEVTANITAVDVNSSGNYAMVVSEDGTCTYINMKMDIALFSARIGHAKKIRCLAFAPNEKIVAICTGGHVRIVLLTNFAGGHFRPFRYLYTRRLSAEPMNCVCWSADGRLLVCGGEDRSVRVCAPHPRQFANVPACLILPHDRAIVGAYFYGKTHYKLACVSRGGTATVYDCNLSMSELIAAEKNALGEYEDTRRVRPMLHYTRITRVPLYEKCDSAGSDCSASAFSRESGIFVAGFSNGVFVICQLPELSAIQCFRAGDQQITSLDLNRDGSWLAVSCGRGHYAQLIVWEWQSESYILKQQSHSDTITSACYSPDGSMLCTGSDDGKVKIWNCYNSFCLVTFTEHEAGVSDVCFTQSGKAILSASLDGTIRAHDLKRYRNFRTMATPKQVQLHRLCTDSSGELVIAASRDNFEIYVWSLETGNILDVFSGHTHSICGISAHGSTLASVSMDKTLRLWNLLGGSSGQESVELLHEGLDVQYSPSGEMLAVLCYDSCISLFFTSTTTEIGTIETRLDVDAGRESKDRIKKSTSGRNKSFTCIAFSPDSTLLLAGGQSNTFCLYSVTERLLLLQFRVSNNFSIDGVKPDVDYRKLTEYGNIDLFDCSDEDEIPTERLNSRKLRLPGTRHSDMSERSVMPSMSVSRIVFNPTGRSFAVVSTEGVSTYALDVQKKFDPFQLETHVTLKRIQEVFDSGDYKKALCMCLHLNDGECVRKVLEGIPLDQIKIVIQRMGLVYAEKLLRWLVSQGETIVTRKLQFYQVLIHELLYAYASDFKQNLHKNMPSIVAIQQLLHQQTNMLAKLSNQNTYALEYLVMAREMSSNCH